MTLIKVTKLEEKYDIELEGKEIYVSVWNFDPYASKSDPIGAFLELNLYRFGFKHSWLFQ